MSDATNRESESLGNENVPSERRETDEMQIDDVPVADSTASIEEGLESRGDSEVSTRVSQAGEVYADEGAPVSSQAEGDPHHSDHHPGEEDNRVSVEETAKEQVNESSHRSGSLVLEEVVQAESGDSDEELLEKVKSLVHLLRRQRELNSPLVPGIDKTLDEDKSTIVDLNLADESSSDLRTEDDPLKSFQLEGHPTNSAESLTRKRKIEEASESASEPWVDIHQMQHLLTSFLSGCFSLRNVAGILDGNAVLSVPAIKTLLLSQKLLLRPFRFNVPRINFHQLKGYKDIVEGSLCFSELIFLMILVNLPSIQSFDLVQEMLCTHLNFCVYLDATRSMHSSPTGHVTCSFFWSTRGKHACIPYASMAVLIRCTLVGLHYLDIPFNLQFHGILRTQIQSGKVIRAQILFDPTVLIRQCDCISQYYKSTAFPIAFGMVH